MGEILILIVVLSFVILFQFGSILYLYKQIKTPPVQKTIDAKELLADLLKGQSIVKLTVIDPDGLMIYRGRL